MAKIFLEIGYHYFIFHNYIKSKENIEIAIEIFDNIFGNPHTDLAPCYHYLGQISYEKKENYEKALEYYSNSMSSFKAS